MPFVHLEMLEGRSRQQKENLVKEMTEVISRNAGAPVEAIHIIISEIKAENLGQNGKLRG